jgi:hypothetical protein
VARFFFPGKLAIVYALAGAVAMLLRHVSLVLEGPERLAFCVMDRLER